MLPLKLPRYHFSITGSNGKKIFDPIRKKFVALTPEEWVRQNFLKFLMEEKKYPAGLIIVEQTLKVNKLHKRCDAVVHDKKGQPLVVLEFKAPDVALNQKVFDQVARYNITLQVKYLIVSNGMEHYCCSVNPIEKTYQFLEHIPEYSEL